MGDILTWLGSYPMPVALTIALAAAFLYLVKVVTEKSIAQQFGKTAKAIELQLARRSKFEETVLLDRFKLVRELHGKINCVLTNLRRHHHGTEVPGLMQDGDIVPLTEVFETIGTNRYLIPASLLSVIEKEAQLGIEFANAKDEAGQQALAAEILGLRAEFDRHMDEEFGLSRIKAFD